jgi:protein-tyrosine-phosphatase
MAEVLMRERLRQAGVAAETSSCGLLEPDIPATPEAVQTMADRGLDLTAHRSRRLDRRTVEGADLVLAMAREHLREVVVAAPDAFHRTFTLKELVRRGEAAAGRGPSEDLRTYLARVGFGRRPADLLGGSGEDDVADPIGMPAEAYRATAEELDDLCRRAAALLAGTGNVADS